MEPEDNADLVQFMYQEWRSTLRKLMAYQALMHSIAVENPKAQKHLELALDRVVCSPELEERLDILFEGFEEAKEGTERQKVDLFIRTFQERYKAGYSVH